MPDAGGGSGGGSVETCTVTLQGKCPVMGTEKVFYTNGSSPVQEISFPNFGESISITAIKNSIIFVYNIGTNSSGSAINLNTGALKAYFIYGDANIHST